jgi:phosphatidylglycerol---prolipoprotein diacylglyceryl transferase
MRRVLFQWHGIEIFSYPAMLYLGLLFGIGAGNFAAHVVNLNSAHVFIATLLLLVPALVGARLLFVISHWEYYRREPKRIWRQSEGGGAMYGGLPLALLVSIPLLHMLHLPFGAFWDVATFTILIGMIFTRAGCLLNGCCAGRATEGRLALYLPDHQGIWQRRIPTQLLEAAWTAILLVGAVTLWQQMPFRGALFLYALAGYGIGRFLLEFTRERQDRVGKIKLYHAISAVLIVLSLTTFFVVWLR